MGRGLGEDDRGATGHAPQADLCLPAGHPPHRVAPGREADGRRHTEAVGGVCVSRVPEQTPACHGTRQPETHPRAGSAA